MLSNNGLNASRLLCRIDFVKPCLFLMFMVHILLAFYQYSAVQSNHKLIMILSTNNICWIFLRHLVGLFLVCFLSGVFRVIRNEFYCEWLFMCWFLRMLYNAPVFCTFNVNLNFKGCIILGCGCILNNVRLLSWLLNSYPTFQQETKPRAYSNGMKPQNVMYVIRSNYSRLILSTVEHKQPKSTASQPCSSMTLFRAGF